MTPIYHSKFHGKNHHTLPSDIFNFPDAGKDPIASPEKPFQGDFVCNNSLISIDDNLAGIFKNKNIALAISSTNNTVCLSTVSDTLFYNSLTSNTLSFSESGMVGVDFVHTNPDAKGCFWVVIIDEKPYGIRLWDTETTVNIDIQAPYIVNYNTLYKKVPIDFIEVLKIDVRGTEPILKQWYLNNIELQDQDKSFIKTNIAGEYKMVATNSAGSITSQSILIETDYSKPQFLDIGVPIVVSGTYAAIYALTSVDDIISLSVSAVGPEPIYYNWFKDNQNIQYSNDTEIKIFTSTVGMGSSVYHATATNYNGTTMSKKFIVYNNIPDFKMLAISLTGSGDVLLTSQQNKNEQDIDFILS